MQAATHLREVTEQPLRLGDCGFVCPAALNELRNAHVDVKTDFIVHLGHRAIGASDGEAEEATDSGTNHDGVRPYTDRGAVRMPVTAVAYSSHLAVSAFKYERPVAVSL